MTTVLRAAAIVIAVLALLDPAVSAKRTESLPVDLLMPPASDPGYQAAAATARQVETDLAGRVDTRSPEPGRARLSVGGALPYDLSLPLIVWLPDAPAGVAITAATASPVVEGQSLDISVALHGRAVAGRTSTISLIDRGVAVARAEHTWAADEAGHEVKLAYAAPGSGVLPLAVRIETPGVETVTADVGAVVDSRRLRALVYEPRPSWAAAFVRRALEGEPRFAVAALSRSTPRIATRLSTAPRSLNALDAGNFDVIAVGAPEGLTPAEITVLDRFASVRGGTVLLLPDARLPAGLAGKFGLPGTEEKLLETPVRTGVARGVVQASELLLPVSSPSSYTVIASVTIGRAERAAIFSVPRGEGAIVVSGLMDAWRYRDAGAERFWRGLVADLAVGAPPALSVRLDPALARPGDRVHVTAAWRRDHLEAAGTVRVPATSAALTSGSVNRTPFRLWPGYRAGIYEAWIDAPGAGTYSVVATGGGADAAAVLRVTDTVQHPAAGRPPVREAAAQSGGGVARNPEELRALLTSLPAPEIDRRVRPMRSPWWIIPFAGCLCAEWLIRRKRGLR